MKRLLSLTFLGALCFFFCLPNTAELYTDGKAEGGITFTKDIAPIFQSKCQECHRKGGIAPMSFSTYEEVRPWARAIKEQVINRVMPPFYAAGPIGHFSPDPRLADEQIGAISRWVDGGAPKGKESDMPPPVSWPEQWKLGQPDLVLKMRNSYAVQPSQQDNYQLFDTDYVFSEDTWIRALEIRPGNRRVVHHASLYILPNSMKAGPDGRIENGEWFVRGGTLYINWVPGSEARVYDEGYASLIPKGTRFGLQVHYAPINEPMTDQTMVGIYFANGVIHKEHQRLYGGTDRIEIPPGESKYQVIQKRRFKTDAIIRAFMVHMHLRGKSFLIRFHYPDGRVETVFELPRYNFNWQRMYKLAKPIQVVEGTVAEYIATWDNSNKNPFNPDPTQVVRFGEKTSDEMMSGTIMYEIPNQNLNILVKNGRRVSSE